MAKLTEKQELYTGKLERLIGKGLIGVDDIKDTTLKAETDKRIKAKNNL